MECYNCGIIIKDEKICPNCGADVDQKKQTDHEKPHVATDSKTEIKKDGPFSQGGDL